MQASAQMRAARPSALSGIRHLRNVGQSAVYTSGQTEAYLRGNIERSQPAAGNYSSFSLGPQNLGGGRSSGGSLLEAPSGGVSFSQTTGSFLRYSTPAVYDGRDRFTLARDAPAVEYSPRTAFMFHHILMSIREGGTAPATNPLYGYRIRDELSNESLENAPPAEDRLLPNPNRHTYSELMLGRIAAERDRAVEQGWKLLTEKQFVRAIPRFEAAEAADRNCSQARVGIFCASILDGSVARAEAALRRIIKTDPDVFKLDINLTAKLSDPELLEYTGSRVGRAARQSPENPAFAALNVFYLWCIGHRQEALRLADELHRVHRTSAFAPMAARMRGETDTSTADVLD